MKAIEFELDEKRAKGEQRAVADRHPPLWPFVKWRTIGASNPSRHHNKQE